MCSGLTLEIIRRSGDIDVFPKLLMAREPATDDCKFEGTKWTLDSYSKIDDMNLMEWNLMEGGN